MRIVKKCWLMSVTFASLIGLMTLFQNCQRFADKSFASTGVQTGTKGIFSSQSIPSETISIDGVNTTAYWQDPDDPTILWGRRMYYAGLPGEDPAQESTWHFWKVAEYTWDVSHSAIHFGHFAFNLPLTLGDHRQIFTGYDPSVVSFGGQKIIAFECSGQVGFNRPSVSVCLGILDGNGNLVAGKTAVVVEGISQNSADPNPLAAGVPKLLVDSGNLYLFWDQVPLASGMIAGVKGWGAKLEQDPATGSYWLAGLKSAATSDSPLANFVFGYSSPPLADLSGIYPFPNHWLVSESIGQQGCLVPLPIMPNCYTFVVGWVKKSLASGDLDSPIPIAGLPSNLVAQYPRVIVDPRGGRKLLLNAVGEPFMRLFPLDDTEPAPPPASGQTSSPIVTSTQSTTSTPIQTLAPSICDANHPPPNWGVKNGQCIASCGGIGGTAAYPDPCSNHGLVDAGIAYDTPYCCKAAPSICDANHPPPNWGVKNGQCIASCGGIGGTAAYPDPCSNHGLTDAGQAYDTPYCCK